MIDAIPIDAITLILEQGAYLMSIPLYVAVLWFAIDTLRLTYCSKTASCAVCIKSLPAPLLRVLRLFMVLVIATTLTFMALQSTWIIGHGYTSLSQAELMAWVTFDWVNGTAYLMFVLALRLYLKWQRFPQGKNSPQERHSHDRLSNH